MLMQKRLEGVHPSVSSMQSSAVLHHSLFRLYSSFWCIDWDLQAEIDNDDVRPLLRLHWLFLLWACRCLVCLIRCDYRDDDVPLDRGGHSWECQVFLPQWGEWWHKQRLTIHAVLAVSPILGLDRDGLSGDAGVLPAVGPIVIVVRPG